MTEENKTYLLDTNIISEIIKPEPDFNVIKKLAEHTSDCAICSSTWHELLYGACRLEEGYRKNQLVDFVKNDVGESFDVISYTKKSAGIHAEIRAALEKSGVSAPFSDTEIAAVAIANNMILVTRNTKHFENIQKAFELKIENWFE